MMLLFFLWTFTKFHTVCSLHFYSAYVDKSTWMWSVSHCRHLFHCVNRPQFIYRFSKDM